MKKTPHPWYKPRGYAHFDVPVGLKTAEALVTDPRKVKSHPFFPFLRYTVTTQKIEKDSITGKASPKPAKERDISFASHLDSHIYSYYAHLLLKLYEERLAVLGIGDSILAFRSLGKSNIEFANDAFEIIKELGECVAYATDISGFFDNLDHAILKGAWTSLLGQDKLPPDHYAVYKSITKYSYAHRDDVIKELGLSQNNLPRMPHRLCSAPDFRTKIRGKDLVKTHTSPKGIPQGSPISALLSNIYLLDFDRSLHEEIHARGGRYLRYCDDILCIVPKTNQSDISDLVEDLIYQFKLEINEKKTDTVEFSNIAGVLQTTGIPLQYLGFTFDGQRKLIRSAAFAKFSAKMRRGISLARQTARKDNKKRNSSGLASKDIWRTKLYEQYSHLGKRNFITYGLRAAEMMDSKTIKRQLKPLWNRLVKRIEQANQNLHESDL